MAAEPLIVIPDSVNLLMTKPRTVQLAAWRRRPNTPPPAASPSSTISGPVGLVLPVAAVGNTLCVAPLMMVSSAVMVGNALVGMMVKTSPLKMLLPSLGMLNTILVPDARWRK